MAASSEASTRGNADRFYRIGVFAVRHRRAVVAWWLVAAGAAVLALPLLLSSIGQPPLSIGGSETERAENAISSSIPFMGRESMLLVFRSTDLTVTNPAYRKVVDAAILALGQLPGVAGATSLPPPATSATTPMPIGSLVFHGLSYSDPHNAYAYVGLSGDDRQRLAWFPAQRDAVQRAVRDASGGQVTVSLLDRTAFNYDLRTLEIADVRVIEVVAVALTVVVLLAGFGAVGAAMVPLLTAGMTILISLGIFAAVGQVASLDVFLLTAVSVVGLGMGADYSLLIVSRYQEELSRDDSPAHAVARAIGTAGKTVFYSGLIVMAAALCLLVIPVPLFAELALGAIVVIAIAVTAALTLLPAVLASSNRWLEFGTLPWRRKSTHRSTAGGGEVWARWARHLMRHPWPYLIATSLLLVACSVPALNMRTGFDVQRSVLAGTDSGRGLSTVEQDHFGGFLGYTFIVVEQPPGIPEAGVAPLLAALRADPEVADAASMRASNLTLVVALPRSPVDSPRTAALVRRIRSSIAPHTVPPGHAVLVGGLAALIVDSGDTLNAGFWTLLGLLLTGSFILLALVFRSLLIPLKAIVMNLLVLGAGYGLLTLTFQRGSGTIQFFLPPLLLAFLFGLSMDYEVFLVRRIQEEYLATGDNTRAVAAGLQRTARPISLAAATVVVVLVALLAARSPELKEFGFALAVAVTIDATLIRLVLVPALMQVLGRWNWWFPRPWARLIPPGPRSAAREPQRATVQS